MSEMGLIDQLSEFLGRSKTAYRQVARIYWQSLQDNFSVDVTPGNETKLAALKASLDELDKTNADLSKLFSIEMDLYKLVDDDTVKSRFWLVSDRFERVVPAATRANYWRSVPPLGSKEWDNGAYVRRQARVLLDQIYANYLVNFARETVTVRLRLLALCMIGLAGLTLLITAAWLEDRYTLTFGLLMLFTAGVVGATISLNQRLQQAVAHDALTADGLFELFSMRTSKAGAISSILFGGLFALVLYLLVVSQTLAILVPGSQPEDNLQSVIRVAELDLADKTRAATAAQPAPAASVDAAPAAPAPANADAAQAAMRKAQQRYDALVAAKSLLPTAQCPVAGPSGASCGAGQRYARILGLGDARSFYLMLVLALVAGFAERLVPDALDRLGKRLGAGG